MRLIAAANETRTETEPWPMPHVLGIFIFPLRGNVLPYKKKYACSIYLQKSMHVVCMYVSTFLIQKVVCHTINNSLPYHIKYCRI